MHPASRKQTVHHFFFLAIYSLLVSIFTNNETETRVCVYSYIHIATHAIDMHLRLIISVYFIH